KEYASDMSERVIPLQLGQLQKVGLDEFTLISLTNFLFNFFKARIRSQFLYEAYPFTKFDILLALNSASKKPLDDKDLFRLLEKMPRSEHGIRRLRFDAPAVPPSSPPAAPAQKAVDPNPTVLVADQNEPFRRRQEELGVFLS